jgi:2-keto-4-pentenoate hydratase/2-oxohepta-3-ene-1,7-dioic acid hydratase in catechol pathway
MKICRYEAGRVGLVVDGEIRDATWALEALAPLRWPLPWGDPFILRLEELRAGLEAAAEKSAPEAIDGVTLLSPVANPSKIVGAPVNYRKHFDEAAGDDGIHHGNTIKPIETAGLFLKSPSSLVGAGEGVALRFAGRRHDHEVELAVVIGRRADRVTRREALRYVAGYAVGLDMTVRGPEERSLRKSIDSYSVLGPWLVTADEIRDPGRLDLSLRVNGELRQSSNTRYLIFDVPRLIEYASSFYTLHPGDVIMTGTPEGVGPVTPGDVIEATVEGIGSMSVQVRSL